jgi:transcriptional regulator with XRE-family HTH domain
VAQERSDLYARIGRMIGEIRRARGWTQEQLAEAASIETSYLARIEGGARRATLDKLAAIAAALDVEIVHLLNVGSASDMMFRGLPPNLTRALGRLTYPQLELLGEIAVVLHERARALLPEESVVRSPTRPYRRKTRVRE